MHFSPSFVAVAATLLSANFAHAHMKLATPHPYGPDTLNNSPLAADGSDFPCKQREGVYAPAKGENTYSVGGTGKLSFIGSAVHGGGSCQVSLTTDKQPTKDSVWKVITSIEGGCPANTDGNLPSNPYGTGASTFDFKIPESIAPGEYTLAWTWLNRIGNREFYMNCAPVTITGAQKKRYAPTAPVSPLADVSLAKRADLPEMFVANINGCTTKESVDIRFPDPGENLQLKGNPANLIPAGSTVCTKADGSPGPVAGAGGSSGGSSGGSYPVPSDSPSPSAPASPSASGGVFAEPSPAPAQPSAPASPAAPPTTPSAAPVTPPSTGGSSGGSGGAQSGACSNEGAWNCINGTQFQRCASGLWSAAQSVAAGTTCTPGVSTELKIAAVRKRESSIHRRRAHYLPHLS